MIGAENTSHSKYPTKSVVLRSECEVNRKLTPKTFILLVSTGKIIELEMRHTF